MKKNLLLVVALCTMFICKAQLLLNENFSYVVGTPLTANTWTQISTTTTNPVTVTTPGLSFSGYPSSGIGEAATMTTSGQDLYKDASASVSAGNTYCSFLLNVTSAQATGDYFLALLNSTSTSAFFARTYIRSSGTGFTIGVAKWTEAPTYSSTVYNFNTTYLVVLRYSFVPLTTIDDQVSLFMFNGAIPLLEPLLADAGPTLSLATDATSLGRIALRQGTATNAPGLIIDGIRFSDSWLLAALPVTLASFNANKAADATILRWTTASENNNSHFEIQRSTDNKKFETIGIVKGSGNSSKKVNYSFSDAALLSAKTVYYRLKQIDFDGAFEYSKTVSVIYNIAKGIGSTLPNPFNDELNVTVNSGAATTASVMIMDMIGKVHHTSAEQLQAGSNKININTTDMPDGIYFVRVSYNGETYTQKVIKK